MEPNGMTYMTDSERKILPQIAGHPELILQLKNAPSEEFLRAAARKNDRGIIGANLTRDELEVYANAFNVKKFGPRVAIRSR